MANTVEKIVADTFLQLAQALETGSFGQNPRIAVTGLGSEHGEANVLEGAVMAAKKGADVTLIGTMTHPLVKTVKVEDEEQVHKTMEQLLDSGEVDGVVTMHYPFPIGVSTVGRVISPANGRHIYIANTTGTSSSDRIEGMVRNAIYGIITAKACGIEEPTVGILNVDGARQTEQILKQLDAAGYPIHFATSKRADGGCVFRGNDLLTGAADVIVTDSLTGNILVKMMSAYTTGGSYESVGFGYGPGIGEDYDRLVMIVSRASGAPVIAGAIEYAAELVRGNYKAVAAKEFAAVKKAGLQKLIDAKKKTKQADTSADEVKAPPKEIVTAAIPGIEVMDLEDAVASLWKAGIYAESGMGCTGPMVMVSDAKLEEASGILRKAGYIQ